MASIRVVLYAEGPGETSGIARDDDVLSCLARADRAPGDPIPEEELGPGHVLVRRALVDRNLPSGAICFVEGLRYRGIRPRGSQLLRKEVIRQLLATFPPRDTPSLYVILVDRDGKEGRETLLKGFLDELESAPRVIAVAREEFEAWLVADESAAAAALGAPVDRVPSPEGMKPREAKQLLGQWIALHLPATQHAPARRAISEHIDLSVLASRCPAFQTFLNELSQVDL